MILFDLILMIPGLIFIIFAGAAVTVGLMFGIFCLFYFAYLVANSSVTSIIGVFKRNAI